MLTAETVTDEQIRQLRIDASDHAVTVICRVALRELVLWQHDSHGFVSRAGHPAECQTCFDDARKARIVCAEMINERAAATAEHAP